jgi:hypothetical protein
MGAVWRLRMLGCSKDISESEGGSKQIYRLLTREVQALDILRGHSIMSMKRILLVLDGRASLIHENVDLL